MKFQRKSTIKLGRIPPEASIPQLDRNLTTEKLKNNADELIVLII